MNITVDFAKGFCSVKDDGVGIKSAEFIVGGRLAQLYCEYLHPFTNETPIRSIFAPGLKRRLTTQAPQRSVLFPTAAMGDSSSVSPLCLCYRYPLGIDRNPKSAPLFYSRGALSQDKSKGWMKSSPAVGQRWLFTISSAKFPSDSSNKQPEALMPPRTKDNSRPSNTCSYPIY